MRRGSMFWGLFLLLLGALFMLVNFGGFRINVWSLIGPLFLILLGIWVVLGVFGRGRVEVEAVSVPLEGAESAHVTLDYGVGRVNMQGSTGPGVLMAGSFSGGLDPRVQRDGSALRLHMKRTDFEFPMFWGGGAYDWDFQLSREIPLAMQVKGGAGKLDLDMQDLRLTDLRVDGGAGAINLGMPAQAGKTQVQVDAGVGTLDVRVPEGVAAQIETKSGLGTISVNQGRFPMVGENTYRSADYDTAEHRLDMRIEGGVGTISVR